MLIRKVLLSAFFIACILFTTTIQAQSEQDKEVPSLINENSCPIFSEKNHSKINQDKIKWIVDGDTIHTQNGYKLRLLHINAPEINHKNQTLSENFSSESSNYLSQLFKKDATVFWTYDKKQKDRYKRDLVFIFNSDGLFINAEMIKVGLAQTSITPPNLMYWRCIYQAEKKAIASKNNIWSSENQLIKSARLLNKNSRFQAVRGTITKVLTDKTYRWYVLDNHLWVGVKTKDLKHSPDSIYDYKVGMEMSINGYVFEYYKKLRMSLRHPAMLLPIN